METSAPNLSFVKKDSVLSVDSSSSVPDMASVEKIAVPKLGEKTFEKFEKEVKLWARVSDVKPEKQAFVLALSLPEQERNGIPIRELVMDEIDDDKSKIYCDKTILDSGVSKAVEELLKFMKGKLGKDDLEDCIDRFDAFDTFERGNSQSVDEYIHEFHERYRQVKKRGTELPSEVLAFKLLRCANVEDTDAKLVKTGMDYAKKDSLYEQTKKSLQKFKGTNGMKSKDAVLPVKLEPAWLAQHEDALWAAGYKKTTGYQDTRYRGNQQNRQQYKARNATGADGKPLRCHACQSVNHFIRDCPERSSDKRNTSWKSGKVEVFLTHTHPEETKNYLIFDSACTSTVCGRGWLDCYIDSLSLDAQKLVKRSPSKTLFRFGGGECLESASMYELPVTLLGRKMFIQTDVVDSPVPLLWSKKDMKAAGVKLDLQNDIIELFGEKIPMEFSSAGHICIPLRSEVESVFITSLLPLQDTEARSALLKLHRQFAHPSFCKLKQLIEGAGQWKDDFSDILQSISENCNVCRQFRRTPSRPVVALPMASSFNEVVSMDIKVWKSRYILHMIDMYSRLCVSVFVKSKEPSVIIHTFLKSWVGAGFGVPSKGLLTDNGGEFSNDQFREMASMLGIHVMTTGAESPFQNGLCEKNHGLVDIMLEKLVYDNPTIPLDVLLCWANMAKNSLQNWNGFSSFQLVFGKNPSLPNVITDGLPALEGRSHSEVLTMHMNALHSARKAFIESEYSERIRRALRSRVRASEEVFVPGDSVYYKREDKVKWLGPAKVIFQDGKVVFLRHGGIMVRASPTRVVKCGMEFSQDTTVSSGSFQDSVPDKSVSVEKNPTTTIMTGIGGPDESVSIGGRNEPSVVPGVDSTTDNGSSTGTDPSRVSEPVVISEESTRVQSTTEVGDAPIEEPDTPTDEVSTSSSHPDQSSQPVQSTAVRSVSGVQLRCGDRIVYSPDDESEWKHATVLSRAGKATGKYRNWYNLQDSVTQNSTSVDLGICDWQRFQEVNVVSVPRVFQSSDACIEAKAQELKKMIDFDVYDVVDQPSSGEVITSRWVLTYKGDAGEIKARLVARGFQETCSIQADAPTVSKSVLRMCLAIASSQSWTLKTTDIKSAFLQGKPLDRDVFLKPPKEADLPDGKVWKLKRCLYGLNDAARQFYNSVTDEMVKLSCVQSTIDSALFLYRVNGKLAGLVAMHIDDFLHAGNADFDNHVMEGLRSRFLPGKVEEKSFRYIGFDISQSEEGIEITQDNYVRKLSVPAISAPRSQEKDEHLTAEEETSLRRAVGGLNWCVQGTRPDMAFDVMDLSTRLGTGTVKDLVRAAKAVRKIGQCRSALMFPPLGSVDCWKIVVFTDASFANLNKVDSSAAHVIFLVGENGKCCLVDWRANKIRRVVTSTLSAETLGLQEGISDGLYVRHLIEEILGLGQSVIPVLAFTDHKGLQNSLYSTCPVDNKLLRVNIGAIKQWLERGEVLSVAHVAGERQLANCLTKFNASPYSLLNVIQKGELPSGYI